jgi:uncharacterized protein (TIGR04255 family)
VRRRYKKSPIAEAICEFQFRGASEWDWTILGLVYQEIKAEFPQKRQEKAFEINIAPQVGKIEKSVGGSLSKMQFLREDGSAMVQVGPDLLAINVLPPYPGWEAFEALIRRQFDVYNKIAHPIGFKRIGLRFVNKIVFPTKGSLQPEGENLAIALDLDYYLAQPDKLELSKGLEWVSVAHDRIETLFEACITDKARSLFEEIK